MRILHVTSGIDPRSGGTTTAIVALAEAQHDVGIDVSVVSTFARDFHPAAVERLRTSGIPVKLIGPHGRFLAHHADIARLLPELIADADVVHIHALWESIQHQTANICRRLAKPHLFTAHGMLDPWSLSQSRLKKQLYLALRLRRDLRDASAIHFMNEIERDLAEPLALSTPRLVEKCIIDWREFEQLPQPGTFREQHPQLLAHRIVLFLGRLHPKKGLHLLLPAFAAAEPRDAVLVLAGPVDDHYLGQLQTQIELLKIQSRVLFTGMLSGIERIAAFADADVFVLPSFQENVGIAIIESLAAGTPVIISDRVNIYPDIVHASVGTVVPTQIEPLTQAITRHLTHLESRETIAARNRAFVRQQYDRLKLAEQWREHYQRLIDSRGPRAADA